MWIDTLTAVCTDTVMSEVLRPKFVYADDISPAELERIAGLKPALLRDWRRRKLIHPSLERTSSGFTVWAAAELLLLARLADHGIGPKRVYGWTRGVSHRIVVYALSDATAWQSPEGWSAEQDWHGSLLRANEEGWHRYLAVFQPPNGVQTFEDAALSQVLASGRKLATIVDLQALGTDLRELACRPLADLHPDTPVGSWPRREPAS